MRLAGVGQTNQDFRREDATLVGTEATVDSPNSKIWQRKPSLAFAAARFLVAATLLFIALNTRATFAQEVAADLLEVRGDSIYRWQIGDADASLLQGECVIQQGDDRIEAESVLLVVDGPIGNVRNRLVIQEPSKDGIAVRPRALTVRTLDEPKIHSPRYLKAPDEKPKLLNYLPDSFDTPLDDIGSQPQRKRELIEPVQFEQSIPAADGSVVEPETSGSPFKFFVGGGTRALEISGRNSAAPALTETINRPESNETVILSRGGVTIRINDVSAQLPSGELMEFGSVTLSADRVVAWLPLASKLLSGDANWSDAPGELYLEGDIVFRQGERIVYAEAMYYNIAAEVGMVLDAEAITTIPEFQGVVRLKADVLQQVSKGNFVAFDAAVTSSRMGVPRYWLQSQRLSLTDREQIIADPETGAPTIDREPFVTSSNNFVYMGGVPLLYWPTFSTTLEKPSFYVSGINIKNDNVFGTQVGLDFDIFQIFGVDNPPKGVDWDLSLDYLSKRGPAIGTTLDYRVKSLFGVEGPVIGFLDAWVIDDTGLDTLGRGRRDIVPDKRTRGRALLRHRHYLPRDFEFIAEVGWISDRNFLEQYLENEWDRDLDHRTALRLRRYWHSHMLDLSAKAQVNDFFTEDEQLPQLDHYLLGGSILNDWLTWSAHSKVGYNRLNVSDTAVTTVPGEVDAKGVVAATRHELAMPLNIGPVKVVPNVSGEISHYGEAANGESLNRTLGQAGVRASLQMWRFDPGVQSSLLNVRGLAHKMEWTAEYFYADSDTNLDELPLYDPLDDNAQEEFRRRFIFDTFGGVLPDRFDPRTYALRHGFQSLVASPSDVIADDLQQFRFGLNQRWQTRRGLPGRDRIVDLFELNMDVLLYPKQDRDNFGETLGPATYDVKYNIGDRVTLLSDGYIDFFDDGLRSISAGFRTSRPGLGDAYIGLLSLEGPISSTVLRGTLDYRLNEKWIVSTGTTYDFGSVGNVGQTVALTRIGESLLLRVGLNIDDGRNNTSVGFSVEPRLFPSRKRGRLGGQLIPPPGVEGLE